MPSIEQVAVDFRSLRNSIENILRAKSWNPEVMKHDVKHLSLIAFEAKKRANKIAHKAGKDASSELLSIARLGETIFKLHYKNEDYLIWSSQDRGLFKSNMKHVLKHLDIIDDLLKKLSNSYP